MSRTRGLLKFLTMLSTHCFTLDDEEDFELDDEPFLCDGDKSTTVTPIRNIKERLGDPQMPISTTEAIEQPTTSTTESKTERKTERPGRRPLESVNKTDRSLDWISHSSSKRSCTSNRGPLMSTISSGNENSRVSSVEITRRSQLQACFLVDEKSLRYSDRPLCSGGSMETVSDIGCGNVEGSVLLQRKFPGPAGMLPRKCGKDDADPSRTHGDGVKLKLSSKTQAFCVSSNPVDDADFNSSSWLAMCEQLQSPNTPVPSELTAVPLPVNYTVAYALKQATSCLLPCGKVPHLRVFVKTLTQSGSQANVVLKDPTGEIKGVVHGQVLEHYKSYLSNAATIVLKQASVFSPSPQRHYLNITLPNVVHVFPANHSPQSSALHSLKRSVDESDREQTVFEEDMGTVSTLLDGLGDDVFADDI